MITQTKTRNQVFFFFISMSLRVTARQSNVIHRMLSKFKCLWAKLHNELPKHQQNHKSLFVSEIASMARMRPATKCRSYALYVYWRCLTSSSEWVLHLRINLIEGVEQKMRRLTKLQVERLPLKHRLMENMSVIESGADESEILRFVSTRRIKFSG